MALHAGLRRKIAPRAILGYSGVLVMGPSQPGEERVEHAAPPAILLVHGEEDSLIPAEALFLSINLLGEMSIPAQWHLSAGLEHGIDNAGLVHGGLFLAQSFGVPVDLDEARVKWRNWPPRGEALRRSGHPLQEPSSVRVVDGESEAGFASESTTKQQSRPCSGSIQTAKTLARRSREQLHEALARLRKLAAVELGGRRVEIHVKCDCAA